MKNTINNKIDFFINRLEIYKFIRLFITTIIVFFLVFLVTLIVENYIWMKPQEKDFVMIFIYMFFSLIILALSGFLLYNLKKKKTDLQRIKAAKKIWILSNEIEDKLLNFLQLKNSDFFDQELLKIVLDSKILEIEKIPFEFIIKPKKALKYLKYLLIPITISVFFIFFIGINDFLYSFRRVINKNTEYIKPCPFEFNLNFENKVIENENCVLKLNISGEYIPENINLIYENFSIKMSKIDLNNYIYTIKNIKKNIVFYFEANGFKSKNYFIEKINIPQITRIDLFVTPPKYVGKQGYYAENKGIIYVNEFSNLKWNIKLENTDSLLIFKDKKELQRISIKNSDNKIFNSIIKENGTYEFVALNKNFKDFENISFIFLVIKDKYPEISVIKDDNSLKQNIFLGKIQDDIMLNKLKVYLYDKFYPENKISITIDDNINSKSMEFKYVLDKFYLDSMKIQNSCIYFEVEDNDHINGFKKSVTEIFEYKNETEQELEQKFSEKQEELIKNTENMINSSDRDLSIKKIEEKISESNNLNWTEKQEIDKQIKKIQDNYDSFKELSENFNKSIEQQIDKEDEKTNEEYENLKESIENTQKRIREEVLKSIEDLKKDISKNDNSLNKVNNLKQQNQRTQSDLKRMLNLLKKFKFENDIKRSEKIMEELSQELEDLSKDENLDLQKENSVKQKTEILKKIIEKQEEIAKKENYKNSFREEKEITQETLKKIEEAIENLKNNEKQKAQQKNKEASEKMKKMKKQMQEKNKQVKKKKLKTDINSLKLVLNNLIFFSFKQENNIINENISFRNIHSYALEKNIIEQNKLKNIFSPIKDSIYKVGNENMFLKDDIFKNISVIDKEFSEFTNNISNDNYGVLSKNQIKIMSETNGLAVLLSDVIENLDENLDENGQGQGDDIQKMEKLKQQQEEISKEIEKLIKKGQEKKGNEKNQQEKESQEGNHRQLQIYKEHEILRNEIMKISNDKVLDAIMENISDEILNGKLSNSSKKVIQNIKQRLLDLEKSIYQKEEDKKRKGESAKKNNYKGIEKDNLNYENKNIPNIEILKYKIIEYNPYFQEKIDRYFK